ncbi:hypothetical protein [Fusobacterium necrophorum]|uniref:hypothetical protein n=1 Tax=Fusobacterium necrophorum TaxID=859 RepID=UPI0001BC5CA0
MSIADIMAELEKKGWKAGDNENDNPADGIYEGIIEEILFNTNEKGTQWFSFKVNLLSENRSHLASLFLTGKMASANLKKFINIVLNLTGEALSAIDFVNEEALAEKLTEQLAGTEVVIELKTSKNGFQNFQFKFEEE